MMKQNGNMSEAEAKRQALLEKLLKKKVPGDFKAKSIPKREVYSPVPLSFAQQRLWVLDRLVPDNAFYNIPIAMQIKGHLDIPVFERAVNEMIRRHESLRTTFKMENEEPVQVVRPELQIKVQVIDISHLAGPEKEKEAVRLREEEASKPFDLEHGPLLRVVLLARDIDNHILTYTMHHIISDAWSMELFKKELVTIYDAFMTGKPSPLPEPSIQYADFAVWQRGWLQGEALEKQLSYWQDLLSGEIPVLEMPADRPRPVISSYQGGSQNLYLEENLTVKLMELNLAERCSMFMTLLSAFYVLLYRYSGQEDILVGSPIANRKRPELEEIIGFFINTMVMRIDLSGNPTFRQVMDRVRVVSAGAYDNQDLPFEKLVEELQPDRYMNRNPLFQAMLVLQNVPREKIDMESKKITVSNIPAFSGSVKFDIWLSLTQIGNRIGGAIEYSTDLFNDDTITRFYQHYINLLESIVADPGQRIDDLQFLADEEKELVLHSFNDTSREYDIRCLHDAFANRVEKNPHLTALTGASCGQALSACGTMNLSYRELNEESGHLARLLKEKGVAPDTVMGIKIERSVEMVVGMMGILKAGGAYLPIDPELPEERIAYMLADSHAKIMLTSRSLEKEVEKLRSLEVEKVFIEECRGEPCIRPTGKSSVGARRAVPSGPTTCNLHPVTTPLNLAYVIYTSGSTGKPKGVTVPHEGISNRLQWMQEAYGLTPDDRVLQKTPYSFDVSLWEFFWTLLYGAVLVMAKPGGHKDSAYLVETINREKITTMHFVPTMLNVFLEDPGAAGISSLKRVICSGEALPVEYRERFFARFGEGVELHNLYGPTEASVDVTAYACEENSGSHRVPIGKPVANTQIYMLDRNLKPVPIGVHGELHIAGIQLARGYLNNPQLSAERFPYMSYRTNESNIPERLYKTGDLAKWLPDGNIEFIDRLDFQVKVRGFRIELGEIESAVREYSGLQDVVVLVREDPDDASSKKLVAYLVPDTGYWQLHQEGTTVSGEQVADWQDVFDNAYTQDSGQPDPTFNIIGWNSSYTSEPLPAEEMRTWVDNTVERILSLKPQNVMEIGCGTGLYLFPIIPHCDSYVGTDIANEGLGYIQQQLDRLKKDKAESANWAEVKLLQRSAENFAGIAAGELDLVILNSVVQYFPSADYLVEVLKGAAGKVKDGGHIFIGDVRSLPLLKTFHASVELSRAEPGIPKEKVLLSALGTMSLEQELVIDPLLFTALKKEVPRVKHAQLLIKYGRYVNELSKFRYDVILHVGKEDAGLPQLQPDIVLDWKQEKTGIRGIQGFRELLTGLLAEGKEPGCMVITSVPNARITQDIRALKQLAGIEEPGTAEGFHPDDLLELATELPYHISLLVSPLPGEEGTFDVVFTQRSLKERTPGAVLQDIRPMPAPAEAWDWNYYTNNPLLVKISGKLVPQLRNFLRDRLPEYMVPSHFVLLDRLPVTANGKLDRKALPEPVRTQVDVTKEFVEPASETEIFLAQLWKDILNLEKVSTNHNFFELGGDSINAIQMTSRANKKGLEMSVQLLFQHQTIADLARAVEKGRQKTAAIGEDTYKEFMDSLDMDAILKQLPAELEVVDIYPATPLQLHQAHFFNTRSVDEPPAFLYQRWDHPMNTPLDVAALQRALQTVSDRNTLLRTLIIWEGLPEPVQVICKKLKYDFVYHDLTAIPADRKAGERNELLKQDWNNTFDRSNSSPMRVGIFKLEEDVFQYYFIGDYMRMEGWSANNLLGEIFAVYRGIVTGASIPPPPPQENCYKEYLHTLRKMDKNAAALYWRSVFKDFNGLKSLTAMPGNQKGQGTGFGGSHVYLPPEMSARFEQFLLENKLSLSVVIQGTWAALLGHYLQVDHVIYGLVTTGRSVPIAGIEEMSGHSINILPVAVSLPKEKTLLDYLKEVWEIQTEWTRHDHSQVDKIYEWCDLPEDRPLFDHYMVIQNLASIQGEIRGADRDADQWKRDRELMFAKMEYPLRLDVFSGYEYCFTCHYYLRFFTTPAVKGLLDNLKNLIENIVENPGQTVAELMQSVDTGKYKSYENESPDGFVQR